MSRSTIGGTAGLAGHGGSGMSGGGNRARGHYNTDFDPVALAVRKRGRDCIVGKLVPVDGEPVLAVTVRHQQGTTSAVSMPIVALEYAERAGCRWFCHRNDRTGKMHRIRLDEMLRLGWTALSDGIPELFVRLESLEPTPWREWAFVERTLLLGGDPPKGQPNKPPVQPALW